MKQCFYMRVYVCGCVCTRARVRACVCAYVIVHACALKSKFSRSFFVYRSESKCIFECRPQTYVGVCAY